MSYVEIDVKTHTEVSTSNWLMWGVGLEKHKPQLVIGPYIADMIDSCTISLVKPNMKFIKMFLSFDAKIIRCHRFFSIYPSNF